MNTKTITAEFTSFPFDSNWVSGTVGNFTFEAKLFDDGSVYGTNKGRVSKLSIRQGTTDHINYDRGWDIRPTKHERPYFKAVMKLLESAPRRFDLVESLN